MSTTNHTWEFSKRFRRNGFGWKSDLPMSRLKEALAEIKKVVRSDPVLAAEGAILLLEKISPALEQVDSSSGAMGSAVRGAITTLVPIIAKPNVSHQVRQRWLERIWKALEEDGMGYLDSLADYWGELCGSPGVASEWSDKFLPGLKQNWSASREDYYYYKGCTPCMSAMYAAGRYDELLALLESSTLNWWHDRRWGAKALLAKGKVREAIEYAEATKADNWEPSQIAVFCEAVLLENGYTEEAYSRYALAAANGTTNLAIFRSIRKKYPAMDSETILRDLAASRPGEEGKWFAAAKDAGLYDLAIEIVQQSPTDPRTLTRAGKDFAQRQPEFALAASLAAISWIVRGYGYEITGLDVYAAGDAAVQAGAALGLTPAAVEAKVRELLPADPRNSAFVEAHLPMAIRTQKTPS